MSIIIKDSDGNQLEYLTQWDVNREITITGLKVSVAPSIHFFNSNSERALVVESTINSGAIQAKVPNVLLQEGLSIIIGVFQYDSATEEGQTILLTRIPVIAKPKPNDYFYEDNTDYAGLAAITAEARQLLSLLTDVWFRSDGTYIQSTTDGTTWNNIVPLSDLKGAAGAKGDAGSRGSVWWMASVQPETMSAFGSKAIAVSNLSGMSGVSPSAGDYILASSTDGKNIMYMIDRIATSSSVSYAVVSNNTSEIKGATGSTGNGITGIELKSGTHASGTYDTYWIMFSDGTHYEFKLYNGTNGQGSGDMKASVYDPQNKGSDIFKYVDDRTITLGVNATNAYYGDKGNTAYNHSQTFGSGNVTSKNPHGLSASDIGAAASTHSHDEFNNTVFWCTYGTTTYAQITAAVNAGKYPKCKKGELAYDYLGNIGSAYIFEQVELTQTTALIRKLTVSNSGGWTETIKNVQMESNLVTSVSASSTDSQYPSAKCVYELLGDIQEVLEDLIG